MDDVRYSELVFLQKLAIGSPDFESFRGHPDQAKIVGLSPSMYVDMAATLLEDLFVRFEHQEMQLLVASLCGELAPNYPCPGGLHDYQWANPREAIHSVLTGQNLYRLRITHRGARRIEELRDLLRRDRILEPFGVLLDLRYVQPDLHDALQRPSETPISVLYADLDRFKPINDKFGHAAGDVVLKAYLEVVRNSLGSFGTAYRGRGDEVIAIIIGLGNARSVQLAEKIRKAVETMECEYTGTPLPNVTASIGVATTPPEARTVQMESVAEVRNRQAKAAGKNRVIDASQK
jgi:diguanylate cyclase (GGDEF)-like protein